MKRQQVPYRLLSSWGNAQHGYTHRKVHKRYYKAAQKIEPRKRAAFLLRNVCDMWEQQGAQRAKKLKWSQLRT